MSTLTLFKSHSPSMGYVFKSGRTIHFVNGEFATSNKTEIEELTQECESGHPCYYIDDAAKTVDSAALDPMAAMKAKWKEEGRLEALKQQNRDMGSTEHSGKLEGIANSKTVVGLVSDSVSSAVAATSGAKATKL